MNETKKWSNPNLAVHQSLAMWAADCAERALHLFEEEHADDERPRVALETLRAWVRGEKTVMECRRAAFAAHAAAREATAPAAKAAARSTGQAVAVAHMWNHCSHASHYAAKAISLSAQPEQAKGVLARERNWQWEHLEKELRPLGFPKGK